MGASHVDRCWEQYLNSGRVTVEASVVKAVLAMVGMSLLALMAAAYATAAFLDDGAAALKGWVCVLLVAVCFLGAGAMIYPVVRRRRLDLTPWGLFVSVQRRGRRETELAVAWQEVDSVIVHRSVGSGDGGDSVDVRVLLTPQGRVAHGGEEQRGYVDLPSGFRISKKNLAALMERIRLSRV